MNDKHNHTQDSAQSLQCGDGEVHFELTWNGCSFVDVHGAARHTRTRHHYATDNVEDQKED